MRRSVVCLFLAACGGGGGGGDDDVAAPDAAAVTPDATSSGCAGAEIPVADISGTEGIAIAADGTVYYSQQGHVGRWAPGLAAPVDDWATLSGTRTVWGMAVNADGILYVATPPFNATPGTIWRIDTADDPPAPTVLDDQAGSPNGLTLGPDGAVYYSDFNGDAVWRVDDLGARTEVTASAIASANGVLFDEDGTLLVASYQTGDIHRLTLDAGHQESGRDTAFQGTGSPDGLARDEQGRVWVTDNGGGEVLRFDPGDPTPHSQASGVSAAANMAFGHGPLTCTDLYVTSAGTLRKLSAGATGVP